MLWSLVLLSLVATHVTVSGQTELHLESNLRDAATAEAAADGAVYQTLFHLLATRDRHWVALGTYEIAVAGAKVEVTIENLAGRVNPNTATPELLQGLLDALGVNPQQARSIADAIRDWRAPGRSFVDVEELGSVLGVTPEVLAQLRPHLTLWWENDPDPTFADPVVMAAMHALGDTRPRMRDVERPIQVVSIVATATNPHGGQFVRHADAIVYSAAPQLPWRILAWNQNHV